jgi:hypothetical protein
MGLVARVVTMIEYIRILHRHDQGISLTQNLPDGYKEYGATKDIKDIDRLLQENGIDLYMALHGISYDFYKDAKQNSRSKLKNIRRKTASFDYLNCCYADLDVGRPGTISLIEARKTVLELEEKGTIPKASIKVYSGQGMWLLWLLGDSKSSTKAVPTNRKLFLRIQKHLSAIFLENGLSPDKGAAADFTRVFRVPGSTNSKNRNEVHWEIQGNNKGTYFYKLSEMKFYISLPESSWRDHKREIANKGSTPKRAAGPKAVAQYRASDLISIFKHFMIKKGRRRNSLTYLARFMFDAGYTKQKVTKQLLSLSKTYCSPTYPSDSNDISIKDIVTNAEKRNDNMVKTFSNKLLTRMFFDCHFNKYTDKKISYIEKNKITKSLSLRSITSIELPKPLSDKKSEIKIRHNFIKEAIESTPDITPKQLQYYFKLEGHEVNLRTIQRDIKCLRQK